MNNTHIEIFKLHHYDVIPSGFPDVTILEKLFLDGLEFSHQCCTPLNQSQTPNSSRSQSKQSRDTKFSLKSNEQVSLTRMAREFVLRVHRYTGNFAANYPGRGDKGGNDSSALLLRPTPSQALPTSLFIRTTQTTPVRTSNQTATFPRVQTWRKLSNAIGKFPHFPQS